MGKCKILTPKNPDFIIQIKRSCITRLLKSLNVKIFLHFLHNYAYLLRSDGLPHDGHGDRNGHPDHMPVSLQAAPPQLHLHYQIHRHKDGCLLLPEQPAHLPQFLRRPAYPRSAQTAALTLLRNTWLVFTGSKNLGAVVTLLWTFKLSWHWAYRGALFPDGVAQNSCPRSFTTSSRVKYSIRSINSGSVS